MYFELRYIIINCLKCLTSQAADNILSNLSSLYANLEIISEGIFGRAIFSFKCPISIFTM